MRKRRVRKDWRGEPPSLLSPFSPDAEEVEGPFLLLLPPLSGAACISSKPPGSLQSPWLPHPCLLHPSATPIKRTAVSQTTSCIIPHLVTSHLVFLSAHWADESPWDSVHLDVFPPPPFSSLSCRCQNACQPKRAHLFHDCPCSPSLCCQSSVCIYATIDFPVCLCEWRQQRASSLPSTPLVHTILQHIIGATSQKLDFILMSFVLKNMFQGHSLTKFLPCLKVFEFQSQARSKGLQAVRKGCMRCYCIIRTFQLTSRLSLGLKVYLFKNGCSV